MNDKPPLLPVLIGVGTIGLGLINGLLAATWAAKILALDGDEPGQSILILIPAFLGLMAIFCVLQIPAGIGILLHRSWGKHFARNMVYGATVTGLLGAVPGIAGFMIRPEITAIFLWGFLTEFVWAIGLSISYQFRSMKVPFGVDAPPVTSSQLVPTD